MDKKLYASFFVQMTKHVRQTVLEDRLAHRVGRTLICAVRVLQKTKKKVEEKEKSRLDML